MLLHLLSIEISSRICRQIPVGNSRIRLDHPLYSLLFMPVVSKTKEGARVPLSQRWQHKSARLLFLQRCWHRQIQASAGSAEQVPVPEKLP